MISFTRNVRKKTLLFQVTVIGCFAFSLYYYLHSRQEEVSILHDLDHLSSQRTQLKQTLGDVAAYKKLLSGSSTLAQLSSELKWEQVDFGWTSVSFTELLRRMEALSHQRKIFVLESFEAGVQDKGKTVTSAALSTVNSISFPEYSERIFRMQGYFLCLCL